MTNFPTGLDAFTTKTDNIDDVLASHVNDLQSAVAALESKLGVTSSAVTTTVDYFLKHSSGAYRTHVHDGSSDDGANIPFTSLSGAALIAQLPYVDEDDMASNSNILVPTQQSVKAYVDGKTPVGFGDMVTSDTAVHQAATDIIVYANGWNYTSSPNTVFGYVGDTSSPATQVGCWSVPGAGYGGSMCFPVKKGKYWQVTNGAVYYTPVGS